MHLAKPDKKITFHTSQDIKIKTPLPQYINLHTHQPADPLPDDLLEIVNLHDHFERAGPGRLYSVGIHPWYITDVAKQLTEITDFAAQNKVAAIGECGLDNVCNTRRDLQLAAFEQQVALANTLGKPLIIHCVRAYTEVLSVLSNARVPAVFHGFNKKPALASGILRAGHYLSFGAALRDQSQVRQVLAAIPADRFFLETDDAAINISEVYQAAADIRKTGMDALILQLNGNYKKVFGQ